MNGWTLAWNDPDQPARGGGSRIAALAVYVAVTLLGAWLVLYLGGIVTTLGTAEGSERHGGNAVRLAEDSAFGLSTMYLAKGQAAWWDYDVEVEGEGGVRLIVSKTVPTSDFIVKVQPLRSGGRGRFAVVVPASGFYSFAYELEPIGGLLGGAEPGSTRYKLKWGVD